VAKQHLLVVDGDAKNLRVMEIGLSRAGFSVSSATQGDEAWAKAADRAPDCIISDIELPALDGYSFCQRCKGDERLKSTPFLFLSSQSAFNANVRALEVGADEFLPKPIRLQDLASRIRYHLPGRPAQTGQRSGAYEDYSGSLDDFSVISAAQAFEDGRKSGWIAVRGETSGNLYFQEGRPIDAESGSRRGQEAFWALLNCVRGEMEVRFTDVDRPETIAASCQSLLMEGLRRLDEWGQMMEQLPSPEAVFEVDGEQLLEGLAEIPDEANGILRLFDGKKSLSRLMEEWEGDELQGLSIVNRLYGQGILKTVAARPAVDNEREKVTPPPPPSTAPVHVHFFEPPPHRGPLPEPPQEAAATAFGQPPTFGGAASGEQQLHKDVDEDRFGSTAVTRIESLASPPPPRPEQIKSGGGRSYLAAAAALLMVSALGLYSWRLKTGRDGLFQPDTLVALAPGWLQASDSSPPSAQRGWSVEEESGPVVEGEPEEDLLNDDTVPFPTAAMPLPVPAEVAPAQPAPNVEPPKVASLEMAEAKPQSAPVKEEPPKLARDANETFEAWMKEGRRAGRGEKFRLAVFSFRKALSIRPESTEAKAELGIALVNGSSAADKYKEALGLLTQVVAVEDANARAWLALGMAYQFTRDESRATAAYRKYLSLEPHGPSAGEIRSLLGEGGAP
jgi:CheY-like chemotaxis protein/tetratricopeptide (TPR) repeat protein